MEAKKNIIESIKINVTDIILEKSIRDVGILTKKLTKLQLKVLVMLILDNTIDRKNWKQIVEKSLIELKEGEKL